MEWCRTNPAPQNTLGVGIFRAVAAHDANILVCERTDGAYLSHWALERFQFAMVWFHVVFV